MARAGTRVGIVALTAAVLGAAGCARGGSSAEELAESVPPVEGTVACDEVFGQGKVIDVATFGEVCTRGEEMVVSRPVRLECVDDRVLTWNEFAWGYEGQEMTMLDPNSTSPDDGLPYDQITSCLQAQGASADAAASTDTAAPATP
jgi:hypothetical protein